MSFIDPEEEPNGKYCCKGENAYYHHFLLFQCILPSRVEFLVLSHTLTNKVCYRETMNKCMAEI